MMETNGSLLTMETLVTMSGAGLAVYYLIQLTKDPIDKKIHIPTDILSAIYAFIILVLAQIALGSDYTDWRLYFLSFFNAILVSMTSAQIYVKASNPAKSRSNGKFAGSNITESGTITLDGIIENNNGIQANDDSAPISQDEMDTKLSDIASALDSKTDDEIAVGNLTPEEIYEEKYGKETKESEALYYELANNNVTDKTEIDTTPYNDFSDTAKTVVEEKTNNIIAETQDKIIDKSTIFTPISLLNKK